MRQMFLLVSILAPVFLFGMEIPGDVYNIEGLELETVDTLPDGFTNMPRSYSAEFNLVITQILNKNNLAIENLDEIYFKMEGDDIKAAIFSPTKNFYYVVTVNNSMVDSSTIDNLMDPFRTTHEPSNSYSFANDVSVLLFIVVAIVVVTYTLSALPCCKLGWFCSYSGPPCPGNMDYWSIHDESGNLVVNPHVNYAGNTNYQDGAIMNLANRFYNDFMG